MADGIVLGPGEGEALRKPGGGRVAVVKAGLDDLTVLELTIEGPFEGPSPRTVEHAFRKRDAGTCRLIDIHAPGGFERELREGSE